MPEDNEQPRRKIRSYVLRTGRMTAGQKGAYRQSWPMFGLNYQPECIDLDVVFNRSAARVLEIGFGMGQSLAEMAKAEPEKDFIGIEVHSPGVGKLLQLIEEYELKNVRVFEHDAVDVLNHMIADSSLDRVQIYFPDPWHKTKHRKRRLIQSEFIQLLRKKLKTGGLIHAATDWQNYAMNILKVLSAADGFANEAQDQSYIPRPEWRPLTKFEKRGERLGHGVWDVLFKKLAD